MMPDNVPKGEVLIHLDFKLPSIVCNIFSSVISCEGSYFISPFPPVRFIIVLDFLPIFIFDRLRDLARDLFDLDVFDLNLFFFVCVFLLRTLNFNVIHIQIFL